MKKGQFQLSFGMIFSIILIVVFIAVAIFVMSGISDIRCSIEQGTFLKNLQDEIDIIWRGAGAERTYDREMLGCKVSHVCFWDVDANLRGQYAAFTDEFVISDRDGVANNLYFYPFEEAKIPSTRIENIDLSSMTNNPTCYSNTKDGYKIPLRKNLNEGLVRIS